MNLAKNPNLVKSISDVAWRRLVAITESKTAHLRQEVVLVDPRETTQMCSRYSSIVKKKRSKRAHNYPKSGLFMDRDFNVAIHILGLGLKSVSIVSRRSPWI